MSEDILDRRVELNGETVPQVMIRFLIQQDIVTLVKSQRPARIRENADVFDFELTNGEMNRLKEMDEGLNILGWTPEGLVMPSA